MVNIISSVCLVSIFVLFYFIKALEVSIRKQKIKKFNSGLIKLNFLLQNKNELLQKQEELIQKGYRNLIKAIQDNNVDEVKRYALPEYINRHDKDNCSFTPLMYAIMNNDINSEILSILLSEKTIYEQYKVGDTKHTAFELAIMRNNKSAIDDICIFLDISESRLKKIKEKLIPEHSNTELKQTIIGGWGNPNFPNMGYTNKGDWDPKEFS